MIKKVQRFKETWSAVETTNIYIKFNTINIYIKFNTVSSKNIWIYNVGNPNLKNLMDPK